MNNLKERVSYLQGLADGMDISSESKEGRLLNEIIDVLGQFADEIEDLETAQMELEDYMEDIDEDLNDLEEEVFESIEDEYHTCGCGDEDDEEYIDVECPSCNEVVCFDADILDSDDLIEVTCPNCDEVVFVNDEEPTEMDFDHTLAAFRDDD